MKICLVSVEYPPFYGGGISTYTDNLSLFLARAGHEVHVISNAWVDYAPADQCDSARASLSNLHIHRIDAFYKDFSLRPAYQRSLSSSVRREWGVAMFWSILVADQLEDIHRQFTLDVVEFPESFGNGYVSLRRRTAGVGVDIPMTVTLHGPISVVNQYNLLSRQHRDYLRLAAMEEYCMRHADLLSSPSSWLAKRMTGDLKLDSNRCAVATIPYPIDFGLTAQSMPTGVQSAAPSLVFAGRLEPRKGVIELVDTAVRLMPDYPSLKLHMIGLDCHAGAAEGSMVAYLKSRIPPAMEDRIIFEGLLPRNELLQRYASAIACIFPAPWDNFPYTCCEAMSRNACIIASDEGGMGELIEAGRSGILFKPGVKTDLEAAIRRVLDGCNVNEIRQRAARRVRDVCDPAVVIPQRLNHYERTIEQHRAQFHSVQSDRLQPCQDIGVAVKVSATISVFLPGDDSDVGQTLASVQTSAAHAGMNAHIYRVHESILTEECEARQMSKWLQGVAEKKPCYILTLRPGDTLDSGYLKTAASMLIDQPRAAWATTWIRSSPRKDGPTFSGIDFSLPLELVSYCPVPFAVIRRDAFDEVGGWNFELPRAWRTWDLWLALAQANWSGQVAPIWQAASREAATTPAAPDHAMSHELILEQIVARNGKLFSDHGGTLWAFEQTQRARKARGADGVFGPDGALRVLMKNASRGVARRTQRMRHSFGGSRGNGSSGTKNL